MTATQRLNNNFWGKTQRKLTFDFDVYGPFSVRYIPLAIYNVFLFPSNLVNEKVILFLREAKCPTFVQYAINSGG